MRRQFSLPEADEIFLETRGVRWETIVETCGRWILLHDFPIAAGYNCSEVTTAIKIETGYPDAQLDMVYFYPALVRADGKAIGALSTQSLDAKSFQRWSRHRTAENPWRVGEDDLSTHVALVEYWVERELTKG